jgi:hypothetical protein
VGSNQPPRYIGEQEMVALGWLNKPALVRGSLHWYPVHYGSDPWTGSDVIIAFDPISESFRHMRAPLVPAKSYIFEVDRMLGIYSYNESTQIVDIWMLQNYETEVWMYKYGITLPTAEIRCRFGWLGDDWCVNVQSVDGDILLLVSHGGWMFHYRKK